MSRVKDQRTHFGDNSYFNHTAQCIVLLETKKTPQSRNAADPETFSMYRQSDLEGHCHHLNSN